MLIQFVDIIGRQFQIVFFGNINDRLCADRPFEMAVDFRLGDIVVFWVEVFHEYLPTTKMLSRRPRRLLGNNSAGDGAVSELCLHS